MIETQYKNIFTHYRELIDNNSTQVINALRDKAYAVFEKNGFPTDKLEDFQHIDIAKYFIPDFGINLKRLSLPDNFITGLQCEIPGLTPHIYHIVNDLYWNNENNKNTYPPGVFIGSLKEFAEVHPEICSKYYGKIATMDKPGIVAFNTMFVQDGFVIYVPKGIVIEQPVQLINLLKSRIDYLVNCRILIIAEDNTQVKLLICDHTVENAAFLVTQVTEIIAGENAVVDLYDLEENSDKVTRLTATVVRQEKTSNVLINNITLNCGTTRNNYEVKLAGEYAEASVCGLVITDRDQYVDNFAHLDHAISHCRSTQLFKYVLQDRATGAFCGRILVEKDAQKTQAYQTNNNLCASGDARMYSKPQLEIYADDVKCSHGLTTGQLDEDALFYMRARGIAEDSARLMLMQAFTADVLKHIRIVPLKERLVELIDKRFKGEEARCGNCAICK